LVTRGQTNSVSDYYVDGLQELLRSGGAKSIAAARGYYSVVDNIVLDNGAAFTRVVLWQLAGKSSSLGGLGLELLPYPMLMSGVNELFITYAS